MLIMGATQLAIGLTSLFPVMVVSCVIFGACDGIYVPALFVGVKDVVGATNYSRGNGITLLAMGIAGIIGTQAGGWIFDSTGSFQIIFYLAAICSLVSAVMFCATAARVRKKPWTRCKMVEMLAYREKTRQEESRFRETDERLV
ncbi:monocarboxylate transporter 10-like [Saccoglossus kowalevskii]|uniref:Monocarboxylate transporter 12-like n=1 Tax=Saccoglossus kowalevskii TaxID=10224 RepID=A0ABM0GR73_SACKO|nr:PREDICTED: monocarboxylate transporter 12-like [Saccoglossus kowalevskii]